MKIAAALIKKAHPLLKPIHSGMLSRTPEGERQTAPLFIVGPPRSGTTILYQIITNELRVNYFDNLSHLFYRDILVGVALSKSLYRENAHNCFTSNLGDTSSCGLHAPSECGPFWRLFLPKEKHYLDENDLETLHLEQIRRIFSVLFHKYARPWVFKNLTLGMRLKLISRLWPGARLLRVRRDPAATVQSILKARKKLGLRPNQWWSVRPPGFERFLSLPETEMVARQVWAIEQQLDNDLGLFEKQNIYTLEYGPHMDDNEKLIPAIARFIGQTEKREDARPYPFTPGNNAIAPEVADIIKKVFHAG